MASSQAAVVRQLALRRLARVRSPQSQNGRSCCKAAWCWTSLCCTSSNFVQTMSSSSCGVVAGRSVIQTSFLHLSVMGAAATVDGGK
jgi:hypothetical protein